MRFSTSTGKERLIVLEDIYIYIYSKIAAKNFHFAVRKGKFRELKRAIFHVDEAEKAEVKPNYLREHLEVVAEVSLYFS